MISHNYLMKQRSRYKNESFLFLSNTHTLEKLPAHSTLLNLPKEKKTHMVCIQEAAVNSMNSNMGDQSTRRPVRDQETPWAKGGHLTQLTALLVSTSFPKIQTYSIHISSFRLDRFRIIQLALIKDAKFELMLYKMREIRKIQVVLWLSSFNVRLKFTTQIFIGFMF